MVMLYSKYVVGGIVGSSPTCTKIKLIFEPSSSPSVVSENEVVNNNPNGEYTISTGSVIGGSNREYAVVLYNSKDEEIGRKVFMTTE